MFQPTPTEAAALQLLQNLGHLIQPNEAVLPVLRGSLLLRQWFGAQARPAADLDLECFARPGGRWRTPTPIQHGRVLCGYSTFEYPPGSPELVTFEDSDAPGGADSLWDYGTPGERFHLPWRDRTGGSGQLQLDLADAGSYTPGDLGVADVELTALDMRFRIPAYSAEAMLAAKVSWLVRGLTRRVSDRGVRAPLWTGQVKDLFDAHLLLTRRDLRPELFRQALLAVGAADGLAWNNLETLFDARQAPPAEADFPGWDDFRREHAGRLPCGPAGMMWAVADGLEPLLGDFFRGEEMPFLAAINADPTDAVPYLAYGNWLGERSDARTHFLRLLRIFQFADGLGGQDLAVIRSALRTALRETSVPWLCQLFGSSARLEQFRQRVEG
jgi:uncharacterized protein (TIGR02996 family)